MAPRVEAGTGWLWRLFLCEVASWRVIRSVDKDPGKSRPSLGSSDSEHHSEQLQSKMRGGVAGEDPKAVGPEGEAELLSSLSKEDHNFSLVHEQGRGGTQWPER